MPAAKRKPAYVVRHSPIHGRGVFATRPIRKGTRVIEYRGQRTTWDVALERPASDPDNTQHTFFFETSDGTVIDANVRGNAARWINHSCDPNCETRQAGGRIVIRALRDIGAGEELTFDYRLVLEEDDEGDPDGTYACACGSARCRGTMLDV